MRFIILSVKKSFGNLGIPQEVVLTSMVEWKATHLFTPQFEI